MIEEGATATSYEPYENICPITGWDGITLTACGKNIYSGWQLANLTKPNGYSDSEIYEDENGRYIKLNGTSNIYYNFPQGLFKENTRYTFITKFYVSDNVTCFRIRYTDDTETWISPNKGVSTIATVTLANKTVKSINVINRSTVRNLYFEECGVFEGVLTATDYEPYQGQSLTIQFPKTIYGGYVDLIKGEVVEDWITVDMGDLNWGRSWGAFVCRPTGIAIHSGSPSPVKVLSEIYKSGLVRPATMVSVNKTIQGRDGYDHTCIEDTDYNGVVSDFKEGVTGYKMAYTLATPVHYPLDPYTITTLRGANNIWTNANDDTEIKYWKHGDDAYQYVAASNVLSSNNNFIIVTDDGYVIGDENDYIEY